MKKGKQTEAKKPTLLYIPQFTHLSVALSSPLMWQETKKKLDWALVNYPDPPSEINYVTNVNEIVPASAAAALYYFMDTMREF